jgi:hypothetical protein
MPQYIGFTAVLDIDVPAALQEAESSHRLQLWSAEEPNLYLIVVKLQSGHKFLDVEGCQVGVTRWRGGVGG